MRFYFVIILLIFFYGCIESKKDVVKEVLNLYEEVSKIKNLSQFYGVSLHSRGDYFLVGFDTDTIPFVVKLINNKPQISNKERIEKLMSQKYNFHDSFTENKILLRIEKLLSVFISLNVDGIVNRPNSCTLSFKNEFQHLNLYHWICKDSSGFNFSDNKFCHVINNEWSYCIFK